MADLSQLEIFVRVVELGGFTQAAAALDLSKSQVSRQVSALEDRLGARLLQRTTRKVSLTDVGAVFYERCARILEDLSEAEAAVASMQESPRGLLRVSVPMSFGLKHVAPAIAQFVARHPGLNVDMSLTDRKVDLLDEGVDLAVRIGILPDSSLIARKLASIIEIVCASPGYLARRGEPAEPEELRQHDCLLYAYQSTGHSWRLVGPRGEVTVPVSGRVSANNGDALTAAALADLGIVFGPQFMFDDALAEGRLQRVLPQWERATAVWAVYPHSRHVSAKVRLFVDFLSTRFAELSGVDQMTPS